ncbi:MAG: uroporphyrinogen-III C-methyltransferase, partial [Eggerthellaceae bacterium]|nr:uroporphyrinogen-III C-methyltransferase [Eggerthellaceae bacterium]
MSEHSLPLETALPREAVLPRPDTCVYLVGAGPGDAGLMTLRGAELLARANVVVYDFLANAELLSRAPESARRVYVGKQGYLPHLTQSAINDLLIDLARTEGGCIVRLKGGDPFVFGRGGEEALALAEAGIPYEVVPGVTSGIAAPAAADIPVTHRGIATSVTLITGNEDPTKETSGLNWPALAALASTGSTLCFYIGVHNLAAIAGKLQEQSLAASTPAALVHRGTLPEQRSILTTVGSMAADATAAGITAPAMILVGPVAGIAGKLADRPHLPLHGRRILVTRGAGQAGTLSEQLEQLGATVIHVPVIRQAPPENPEPLRRAISALADYDWLAFTSPNGVDYFFAALAAEGYDLRALGGVKLAVMGPGTAAALARYHLVPDLIPASHVAEGLADALIATGCGPGTQILVPRAAVARDVLPTRLAQADARVDVVEAYRTLPPEEYDAARLRQLLDEDAVDGITFTSSSTVNNLVNALGGDASLLSGIDLFSIGPI